MSVPPGTLLAGRYLLHEPIAFGGYGEVWRGADQILSRPVAVKLLLSAHARHPETLARFRTEARHAGVLAHENIARVYDYVEPAPPGAPLLVMELIDGPSLGDVLTGGPLTVGRTMHILAGAATGLDAAHAAGLIHRDIKPGNLLLSHGDIVKITDFGISHAVNSAPVTATGMLLGTPAYMAPERLAGARATAASDLYSLGVVAHECLTGNRPFEGIALEVALAHQNVPVPPLPGWVPTDVAALVSWLMAKDPAARPGSAGEVARQAAALAQANPDAPVRMAQVTPVELPQEPPPQVSPPSSGPAQHQSTLLLSQPVPGPVMPGPPAAGPGPAAAGLGSAAGGSGRGTRRRGRRIALGGGVAAAAVLGLILAVTLTPSPAAHPSPPAPTPSSTSGTHPASAGTHPASAETVTVNGTALAGRPVQAVVHQLQQMHLTVHVQWQPSDQQSPGNVVQVQPTGRVALTSTITVIGALRPAGQNTPPAKQHGHGHGHGHKGQNGNQGD